jgi:hypothetical protein
MKVDVFHKDWESGVVFLAATVEIPDSVVDVFSALDFAFEKTNTIKHSWIENPEVTVVANSRSTSVGDYMAIGEDSYRVEPAGFSEWNDMEVEHREEIWKVVVEEFYKSI